MCTLYSASILKFPFLDTLCVYVHVCVCACARAHVSTRYLLFDTCAEIKKWKRHRIFRNKLIFNYSRASSSVHRLQPVLAPLYRNHLSDVGIVMPLVLFTFNVTMLFLIYYFQTTSWTSNYNLRTPPHMQTRQQALNVACYRVRTGVFAVAYQQTPSSRVPFIINLKQSRCLIVSVPINADRPTINTCHLSGLELKNGRCFLHKAAGL